MNWGRESWSSRCSQLFGLKKDQYRLQRHRLQLEVHVWYDSSTSEVLINRHSFPTNRSQILNRNNDGISRWLEQQHNRRKEVLERASGQLSILSFCGSPLARRQNKHSFLTRIQEARRANLPTPTETPNTSDGDHSPAEEPPD